MFWGCTQAEKQNIVVQENLKLQIYNDLLIEVVENYMYLLYLGEDSDNILFKTKDSSMKEKKRIKSHNKLFNEKERQKTVYLCDNPIKTAFMNTSLIDSNFFNIPSMRNLKVFSKVIYDSLNSEQTSLKAKDFKSETFLVKSILDYSDKDSKSQIGIVKFSKIFYYKNKNEAIVYCQFSCGGLCGKGLILKIRKQGYHWKVIENYTTWVS